MLSFRARLAGVLAGLIAVSFFSACSIGKVLTECPPYHREVAFSSYEGPPEEDPGQDLDKMYEQVREDIESTGVDLDEVENGFRARGIELTKELGPDGRTRELRVSLDGDIAFATGSSRLTPQALELIEKIAAAMLEYEDTLAKVEGHTDSVGTFGGNMRLSRRRAEAVESELLRKGIAGERIIEVQGYADTRKIVDTMGPEVRNRRVEIRLTPVTIVEEVAVRDNCGRPVRL